MKNYVCVGVANNKMARYQHKGIGICG